MSDTAFCVKIRGKYTICSWSMPSEVSLPSFHHIFCLKYQQTERKLYETLRYEGFFHPLITDKIFFCTWGQSVQFFTHCIGLLAPVPLVSSLRGRAAAVLSQSSITVSSGCGHRAMSNEHKSYLSASWGSEAEFKLVMNLDYEQQVSIKLTYGLAWNFIVWLYYSAFIHHSSHFQ